MSTATGYSTIWKIRKTGIFNMAPVLEASTNFSDGVREIVELEHQDANLPGGLDSINLTLNRKRLAEFFERFGNDSDVHLAVQSATLVRGRQGRARSGWPGLPRHNFGMARNRAHSVDLNGRIVETGRNCAKTFQSENYQAELGDIRETSTERPARKKMPA